MRRLRCYMVRLLLFQGAPCSLRSSRFHAARTATQALQVVPPYGSLDFLFLEHTCTVAKNLSELSGRNTEDVS